VVHRAVHDEELALRKGPQDWLVKGSIDRSLLMRVIRHATERHRLMLTVLYNRRGFLMIADEQFKLARRIGHDIPLAFVDVDGMKRINDKLGYEIGDRALIAITRIPKSTFRASDVIVRLGRDEFIIWLVAVYQTAHNRVRKRLLHSLAEHNQSAQPRSLSASASHTSIL
jgi:diguanylate cyclase (GGDEF)-like protein